MITWLSTEINLPEAGREIIAKNPNKIIRKASTAKQCRVRKFHPSFSENEIAEIMLDDGLTLWSYTE